MYKRLDEPIDAIVHYSKGFLKPLRFLWNGRSFRIARVTGTWKAPQGEVGAALLGGRLLGQRVLPHL
jgi:hypothetical protein